MSNHTDMSALIVFKYLIFYPPPPTQTISFYTDITPGIYIQSNSIYPLHDLSVNPTNFFSQ